MHSESWIGKLNAHEQENEQSRIKFLQKCDRIYLQAVFYIRTVFNCI